MSIAGIRGRLSAMRRAVGLSSRLRDWPALAVLGLAQYCNFSHPALSARILRRLFPRLAVRTDDMGHVAVVLDPSDWSHLMIFDEVVGERVYDLNRVGFGPDLIVDCGGHIGLFAALAAGRFPGAREVVFEPMPKNADVIEAMVRRNKLKTELERAAVSDRDYTTRFFERMSFGGSLSEGGEGVVNSYPVRVVNLIAAIERWAPQALLLKMDIEGEEETLLPRLIPHLPARCAVFFETHTADKGWSIIADAFTGAGFEVETIRVRDPFRDGIARREGMVRSAAGAAAVAEVSGGDPAALPGEARAATP